MVEVAEHFASWGGWHCRTFVLSESIKFDGGNLGLEISFEKDSLLGLPLTRDQTIIGSYWLRGDLKVDKYRTYYHLSPPFIQRINTGRKINREFEDGKKDIVVYPTTRVLEDRLHSYFESLQNDARFKGCPLPSAIPIHQLLNEFEPVFARFQRDFIRDVETPRYSLRH